MAKEPPQKYTGELKVDLTSIADILVDLPPGDTQRRRQEQDGIDEVIVELAQAASKHGAAGITTEIYNRFLACNAEIEQIRAARPKAEKLAEVLLESEIYKEDVREGLISMMCKAVKTAAQHDDPSITALYEKTLKYNAQAAEKAVKTRRKNAQGNEEEGAGDAKSVAAEPTAGEAPQKPSGG